MEQVTNYQCTPCKGANEVIDSLADAHPDKIFPIRYHVNTPYPGDPLNNEYADSMVSFHGLDLSRGVPITLIGGDFVDYGYDDNQRADYVQRWYNRIKEKSQTQPYYTAPLMSVFLLISRFKAVIIQRYSYRNTMFPYHPEAKNPIPITPFAV
ncbi:MAG: hypothetical protein ABIL88_03275 [candidate division WOR-3 bacterium]